MSTETSILVIGAGELGTPILQHLSNHPQRGDAQITVLLRQSSIESKRALVSLLTEWRVSTTPGDIVNDSQDQLAATFERYDTVVSAAGMVAPSGTQTKLASAVLQANVRRYIPWQYGLDYDTIGRGGAQDLFDEQLNIRDMLRGQSATEWIIVSTGIFMTFLFEEAFDVVVGIKSSKPSVHALGSWQNKVTYTHPEDIGKATAQLVIADWTASKNKAVFVAGDTASFAEVADAVEAAAGRPVARELWDEAKLASDLKHSPHDGMAKYRAVLAAARGVAWDRAASYNAAKGFETISLRSHAAEQLAAKQ